MKKVAGINLKNKTLVIGCGQLGATIANKFSKEGKNLLIIDESEKSFRTVFLTRFFIPEKWSGRTDF